jgi:hypothetical protein
VVPLLAASALLLPSIGVAQVPGSQRPHTTLGSVAADSFVTVVPGPQFKRGGFFRFFWGTDYRKEWNTRVRVPVLDLNAFAGGLTLLEKGGPGQSRTLFFDGADGRRYAFRSIVKSLGTSIPGVVVGSPIGTVMEDLNSALHPAAPLITSPLESGTDVLHSTPAAYLMPDSPALGEHREEFGDMLGVITPSSGEGVIESEELFVQVRRSPADRADSRRLLAARLIDVFVGDWDRDRSQWRWVREDATGKWRPIAEDRDEAFVRMDGLLPSMMHFVKPALVGFKEEYPSLEGLTYTGQELDRQLLAELERPTWDSVAASVTAMLTDELIEGAVRQQPSEMYAIGGARLVDDLKQRRDALRHAAGTFYEILAGEAEVHGTDAAETVWITGLEDGSVEIILAERREGASAYFQRRFLPVETNEIRVRLHGGDDVALLRGDPDFRVRVRILGGDGADEFRFIVPAGKLHLYDQAGGGRLTGEAGRGRKVNASSYEEWAYSAEERIPPEPYSDLIRLRALRRPRGPAAYLRVPQASLLDTPSAAGRYLHGRSRRVRGGLRRAVRELTDPGSLARWHLAADSDPLLWLRQRHDQPARCGLEVLRRRPHAVLRRSGRGALPDVEREDGRGLRSPAQPVPHRGERREVHLPVPRPVWRRGFRSSRLLPGRRPRYP